MNLAVDTAVRPTGWGGRVAGAATWLLAAACGLWAVLRVSGVAAPWPVPVLLAFTPWAVVLSGVTLAVAARRLWAMVVAAAGALALSVVIVPRAWGSVDHRDGVTLRVMTINLHAGDADPATVVRLVATTG